MTGHYFCPDEPGIYRNTARCRDGILGEWTLSNENAQALNMPDGEGGPLLRDQVAHALRSAILDGTLKPGQRLTEHFLIELVGVSRTSVREAVRVLQAERLLENSSSRGVRVAMPTLEEAEHIYEIRSILEPAVARLLCERATDDAVAALRAAFDEDLEGKPRVGTILSRFDTVFFSRCGNPVMLKVAEPLYSRIILLRSFAGRSAARHVAARQEIEELITAIEARSVRRATAASLRHVRAARAFALRALVENPDWRMAILPA